MLLSLICNLNTQNHRLVHARLGEGIYGEAFNQTVVEDHDFDSSVDSPLAAVEIPFSGLKYDANEEDDLHIQKHFIINSKGEEASYDHSSLVSKQNLRANNTKVDPPASEKLQKEKHEQDGKGDEESRVEVFNEVYEFNPTVDESIDENYRHRFDGAIIVPDQKSKRILILHPDTDWNDDRSILWSWSIKKAKGIPKNQKKKFARLFVRLNDVKRVMFENTIHIIFVGNGGDGVAIVNMESEDVVYWADLGGRPHSIALLPDGNLVVADSKPGTMELYRTERSNSPSVQEIRHGGIHGLVWDDERQLMWAWGGDKLRAFSYNHNRQNPQLTKIPSKQYRVPDSWKPGGGHDLAPFLNATKLFFSWRLGIGIFDIESEEFIEYSREAKNPKGIDFNPYRQSLIYTKPDPRHFNRPVDSSRSYQVHSLTEESRARRKGSWYKARWFIHNTFSYLNK